MPTPSIRRADKANLKDLFAGLKAKYEAKDATIVHDPSYVHTDNNFSDADKSKLDGVSTGAEANVVKGVDGTTIAIDASGIISLALPNLDGAGY